MTWLVRGGIETWLLSMLQEMPREVVGMDFCCKGSSVGPLAEAAERHGARVFHCPLGIDQVRFVRNVRRLVRDRGYDIVHNHLEAYSGLGAWAGQREGVPVITSFHNTSFGPQTPWTRRPGIQAMRAAYARLSIHYAVRASRYVTGCSRAVLSEVAPGRTHQQGGRVLYYGMEPGERAGRVEREALRRELGWPADSAVVVHVGRMVEQKNHHGLLDVFRRVADDNPRARLLCVGDGPLRPAVEGRIVREGLTARARCVGVRSDVVEILRRSDVLLLPSIHEGFGLVALEAGGVGLPVVGSRIPGLDEAVRDGVTGVLHAVGDVDGMARSVEHILGDREVGARLGEAGRMRVATVFGVRSSAERLDALYRECAGVGACGRE